MLNTQKPRKLPGAERQTYLLISQCVLCLLENRLFIFFSALRYLISFTFTCFILTFLSIMKPGIPVSIKLVLFFLSSLAEYFCELYLSCEWSAILGLSCMLCWVGYVWLLLISCWHIMSFLKMFGTDLIIYPERPITRATHIFSLEYIWSEYMACSDLDPEHRNPIFFN